MRVFLTMFFLLTLFVSAVVAPNALFAQDQTAPAAPVATAPVAADPDAAIEDGKTVSFDYWLTVDGKEVENSQSLGPVEYVQGKGDVIPGLEKNLVGLKAGAEKSFKVSVEDGYGEVDAKAVQEVERKLIPADIELKPGVLLQMNDDKGNIFPATVLEVKDDKVKLDFNHPLAGKELNFKVKVVSVK